jgi:hypothetical protein
MWRSELQAGSGSVEAPCFRWKIRQCRTGDALLQRFFLIFSFALRNAMFFFPSCYRFFSVAGGLIAFFQ